MGGSRGLVWRVLKNRLKKEGNETVTICNAFKLPAKDGKMRLTPIADQEQLFRLIQSIPSHKAEPFKVWMATVASERLDEMQDPKLTIERAMTDYRRLGYSEAWINQRLKSIEVRKELTDEWKRCGIYLEYLGRSCNYRVVQGDKSNNISRECYSCKKGWRSGKGCS